MKLRSILAVILAICMLCGALVACNSSSSTTDTDAEPNTTVADETTNTEAPAESKTEESREEKTETTTTQSGGEVEEDVAAGLPEAEPELTYAMYGGYEMTQYAEMAKEDYLAACKYYEEEGYTLWSSNVVGNALSSVYVNGDAYANVMYNGNKQELYLGESESGASAFPEGGEDIDYFDEPTITQHYSDDINGMCYFIKLSDGSFIVVDGGYEADLDDAFKTLAKLNGSEYGIHIRAWIITHSHGDHYEMFDCFSKKYASRVTLDTVMFSPLDKVNAYQQDVYLNGLVYTAADRFGAETCHVFTGMSFIYGDITLEFLASPEHIYKTSDPQDFNETSVVFRIRNDEGSMIFLADCGEYVCDWIVDTYGEALKSDMVQLAHHGCETATIAVYEMIAAETLFCPSSESLLNTTRGGETKQYYIEAESSKEFLYHGFGNITRPLSYKSEVEYVDITPDRKSIKSNDGVTNIRVEDGVIKYDIENIDADPFIYIDYRKSGITTTAYNALKIVVGAGDAQSGTLFFSTHKEDVNRFSAEKRKYTSEQGVSNDDKTTIIVYLGDIPGYADEDGKLNSIRFDLGTENGQTIEIYSIEIFKMEIDE